MKRQLIRPLLCISLASLVATAPLAAQTLTIEAFDNATIQPSGPRSGNSGINFFNIEGADFGNFASYGVARFDLASTKLSLDNQFGPSAWTVNSLALLLTQSNAAFTANGGVTVYASDTDGPTPLSASGFQYANRSINFADAAALLSYSFTQVATGTVESHLLLNDPTSVAGQRVLADIGSGGILTLVLAETAPGVAATYAGYNNSTWSGPTLQLTVSAVPEPSSLLLLACGLAATGAALRRRA